MIREYKNFELFVRDLVTKFEYSDFSPTNTKEEIFNKFQEIFHVETAFWTKEECPPRLEKSKFSFYISPKSYDVQTNDIAIVVRFVIDRLCVNIEVFNIEHMLPVKRVNNISIQYKEIWLDHQVLCEGIHNILLFAIENVKV